jgi:hypothetical protein
MCSFAVGAALQSTWAQAGNDPRARPIEPRQPYAPTNQKPSAPRRVQPGTKPAAKPGQAQLPQPPAEPWWAPRTRLGIAAVEKELKDAAPIGRGITAAHIEGAVGAYAPNSQRLNRVRFIACSGPSQFNEHATATARVIYGPGSLAPGITDVHCYASSHWLADGFLRTATAQPPREDDRRIMNHSWIAGGHFTDEQVLRRVDYVIDTRDVIMVVGVNNGKVTPVPALLSSAYNVIAVGSNNSSGGYTRAETAGRCKPDIIAPTAMTSFATPMVAAVAGRLLEMADAMVAGAKSDGAAPATAAFAAKSPVIRAVLFAGAQKTQGWTREQGKPLDQFKGAGRVRFDNSHAIMSQPLESASAPLPDRGWHYATLAPGEGAIYRMNLPENKGELSVFIVWNRRIDGRTMVDPINEQPVWLDAPRMADLDLQLIRHAGAGDGDVVAESASRIDNLEHIYLPRVAAGEYELRIARHDALDEAWDYALAWRLEPPRPAAIVPDAVEEEPPT